MPQAHILASGVSVHHRSGMIRIRSGRYVILKKELVAPKKMLLLHLEEESNTM